MLLKTEDEIINSWQSDEIVVSICCLTYNHEQFIAEAIESFLMQETSFPFEIIIRDDASTDATQEVIESYKVKYPNIIQTIYEKENTFSKGIKPIVVIEAEARGKYIALCEGDDYWTDKHKLQLQVSFLENNPDYSMSFHRSDVFDEEKNTIVDCYPPVECDQDFTIYDFIKGNWASTASIVKRREDSFNYPEKFSKFKPGDWPLNMIYASKGKIKYHADVMSLYRLHHGGVWSKKSAIKKHRHTIYMLEEMDKYFDKKYHKAFSEVILKHIYQQIKFYLEGRQVLKAFALFRHATQNYKVKFSRKFKFTLKLYKLFFQEIFFQKK